MQGKKTAAILMILTLVAGGASAQPVYGWIEQKPATKEKERSVTLYAEPGFRDTFAATQKDSYRRSETLPQIGQTREHDDYWTQMIREKEAAEAAKKAEKKRMVEKARVEAKAEAKAMDAAFALMDENYEIGSGLSDEQISVAEDASSRVSDAAIKARCEEIITRAKAKVQQEKDAAAAAQALAETEQAATDAMMAVWDFPNGKLCDGATRDMLDDAQAKIETLPDGNATKEALTPAIAAADAALTAQSYMVTRKLVDAATVQDAAIQVPAGLGTIYTVTMYGVPGWYMSNGEWYAVKQGTGQARVHDAWVASGAHYQDGFAVMNGRYLIACTSKYGRAGDLVTFYLSDGTALPCIIADQKCESVSEWDHNPANEWGHLEGRAILEFEVQPEAYRQHGNPGSGGSFGNFLNGKNVVAAQPEGSAY